MGLQGYVGNSQDVTRIRRQQKQREEQRKKFEELKNQSKAKVEAAGLRRFGAGSSEQALETAFKNETIGLVTREEFIQKRTTLEERIEEAALRRKREEEDRALADKERRKKKKAKLASRATLSFLGEGEEEDLLDLDDDRPKSSAQPEESSNEEKQNRYAKYGKDPCVPTDFLPDADRERKEAELREKFKQEWKRDQEEIKSAPLSITYSYWDGTGHRREIQVEKGMSIGEFLKLVREQLAKEFREMRAVSVDNLMYIKEDVIIPHNHTFYDLIINKARGKSGPLFHFDVHEDVRIVNDGTIEKNESHAGKVVERHWYDKNKHIFPASRWEVYDPDKVYEKYTIYG
ncbi:hypothetical protein BSKO_01643 [Bryopsis sp. KO-2023]|nr:hypothetical protein BSKO_01643 [Bryopsis sp. KO-2023]